MPLLAPAYDEEICPHWAERWEIRTRPLGCQVSTITSLTSVISIASTLAVVLLIYLAVLAFRWLAKLNKNHPNWWQDGASVGFATLMLIPQLLGLLEESSHNEERAPLLWSSGETEPGSTEPELTETESTGDA